LNSSIVCAVTICNLHAESAHVAAEFGDGGDAAPRKVGTHLAAVGTSVSETEIRARMDEFTTLSIGQLKAAK